MVVVLLHIAIFFLVIAEYKKALLYINKFFGLKFFKEDLYCTANVLRLIIYFESQTKRLVPAAVRSSYRFLSKMSFVSEYEKTILHYFRKIVYANHAEKQLEFFKQLNAKLQANTTYNPIFDYSLWLESKIKNKPLMEIFKEKAKS